MVRFLNGTYRDLKIEFKTTAFPGLCPWAV
jgi:hypothetical protein